jgi:hypothetical protein
MILNSPCKVQAEFWFAPSGKAETAYIFERQLCIFSLKNPGYIRLLDPFADFFMPQASPAYRRKGL